MFTKLLAVPPKPHTAGVTSLHLRIQLYQLYYYAGELLPAGVHCSSVICTQFHAHVTPAKQLTWSRNSRLWVKYGYHTLDTCGHLVLAIRRLFHANIGVNLIGSRHVTGNICKWWGDRTGYHPVIPQERFYALPKWNDIYRRCNDIYRISCSRNFDTAFVTNCWFGGTSFRGKDDTKNVWNGANVCIVCSQNLYFALTNYTLVSHSCARILLCSLFFGEFQKITLEIRLIIIVQWSLFVPLEWGFSFVSKRKWERGFAVVTPESLQQYQLIYLCTQFIYVLVIT